MTATIRDDLPVYDYPSSKRTNAPTVETASRLTAEEKADQAIPEGDGDSAVRSYPTLTWNRGVNGGREPTYGPLYIHDKVDPYVFVQSMFEDGNDGVIPQYGFEATNGFRDESGKPAFDASWYPYHYKGNWSNRLIRATGQRAMASLIYKDKMRGAVNLIYMDPPYNISFRSNFQIRSDSPETGETLDDVPNDGATLKAFRDNYRNGIHSYLDGLREQLVLARELLADDGSFIMQIGPDNLHYAALAMGEVFGMENHVATIPYKTGNTQAKYLTEIGNWLVWFAKDKANLKYRQLYEEVSSRAEYLESVKHKGWIETPNPDGGVDVVKLTAEHRRNPALIPSDARIYSERDIQSAHTSSTGRSDTFYLHPDGKPCEEHADAWDGHSCSDDCDKGGGDCPVGRKCGDKCRSNAYPCPTGKHWSVSLRGIHSIAMQNRLHFGEKGNIVRKHYESDVTGRAVNALWGDGGRVANRQYIVETPARVLDRCVLMTTDPGDLVLDLTCGSGAMPATAERWGRRWIGVDVAAVSIAIARERITSTIYPNHALKDSPEGARMDYELEMSLLPPKRRTEFVQREYGFDPARGFVNERQMRVSAATVAYGPDFSKDVIRHPDRLKRSKRKWRVATAFTVETDSPYRSVRPEEMDGSQPEYGERNPLRERIVESLLTSGVRNDLDDGARYRVENLLPCDWSQDLTHTGDMIDANGKRWRGAFYIGAEDETISRYRTNYAATAALEMPGGAADILAMVGFGRDANAHNAVKHPRLTVLQVAANIDLQLAGLKPARDDNAFVVVSEPEVRLHRLNGGFDVQVEVLGLSCFNPDKGIVEARSTNRQIMGMMVDTSYDGDSFRARLMNVIPNKRNQKTLRDLRKAFPKIGDEEFETMKSAKSLPFPLPEAGVKLAVKVIDLTGMEHMAVIDDPRDPEWYEG